MKKLITLVLALAMVLSFASFGAVAEEVDTLVLLVPETDPAARPFQLMDLQSGKTTCVAWEAFQVLEAKYGLEIVFDAVTNSQYDTAAQTRLAAGLDLPDIMSIKMLSDSEITSYSRNGTFLPVNKIIEEYCTDETKERINTYYPYIFGLSADPVDGNSYFFAAAYTNTFDGVPNNYIINDKLRYDWMQNLGLETPESVYELYDVLVAFQENDANGNGVIGDEKFYIPENSFYALGNYFGLPMDLLWGELIDEEGNYYVASPWLMEGAVDYFELLRDMYDANLLEIGGGYTQLTAENSLAGFHAYAWQHSVEDTSPDPNAYYIDLPYDLEAVTGIDAIARMDPFSNFPNENFKFAVLNTCDNLEAVGRYFDMLFSEEYEILTIAGVEGVTYNLIPGAGDRPYEALNIQFVVSDGDVTAMRESGLCKGYRLWGKGVMPRITNCNTTTEYLEAQIAALTEAGDWQQAWRLQAQLDGYDHGTVTLSTKKLAMPNDEEAERIAQLTTDLETKAAEIWYNLVTGVADIADYDAYVEELRAIGLDELMELQNGLLERMVEAMG